MKKKFFLLKFVVSFGRWTFDEVHEFMTYQMKTFHYDDRIKRKELNQKYCNDQNFSFMSSEKKKKRIGRSHIFLL